MKMCVYAAAVLAVGAVFAAEQKTGEPEAKISIYADRPEFLYGADEKVEFVVKATSADGAPFTNGVLEVILDNYGGRGLFREKITDGVKLAKPVTVKADPLGKPGFMRCRVLYRSPSGKETWEYAAVAVDPRAITSGAVRPKDFDAFWDGEIARLEKEVPDGVTAVKDEKASTETHTCFRMCAKVFGERSVWGFLTVPNGAFAAEPKRYPVKINVPGAGVGVYWFPAQKQRGEAITLTINVFDFEPGWETGRDWKIHYERYHDMHRRWEQKGGLREKSQSWAAGFGQSRTNTFYYGAILGANRMVNWLCSQPYIDKKDVAYRGQSQGGAFGIFLASLNTNLTAATISEPALTGLTAEDEDKHQPGWPNPINMQTNDAAKKIAREVAPYFDGAHFAPRIKCPVRFAVGYIDLLCPPHCVYAAYNALKPTVDRRIVLGPGVGHGCPKEPYQDMEQRLTDSWKKAAPYAWAEEFFNPDHPGLTDRYPYPDRTAPSTYLYVAPDGDDGAEGTLEKPLRTMEGARDRLRKLTLSGRRYLPRGGGVVFFRSGIYVITNTIKFTKNDSAHFKWSPIVYRAYPGEKPVFTGGLEFSGTAELKDPEKLSQLPEGSKGKVKVIDLKAKGFDDFAPQAAFGYRPKKPCHTVTDLYRDGKPLDVAVSPNPDIRLEDYYRIGEVLDKKHDVFKADFPDMDKWAKEEDVMAQGWWTFLWASTTIPVEKIDPVAKTVTVAREPNIFYYAATSNNVFTLENGLPALDRENEWVFDRKNGLAYVLEPKGAKAPVYTVTRLAKPMITVTDVNNFRIEGLTFEYGRTDAIIVSNAVNFAFLGNTVRNFGGRGLQVYEAKEARVQNNTFHHFGFAALILTGGDRPTLTPGMCIIENNDISFTGRRQRTSPESSTCQVGGCGNVLTHNWFHDTPGSALRLAGNDHRVSFNRFERCSFMSDDNGAIDMCNNMSYAGNRFVFNEFYDIGYKNPRCGNAGIRLDDFISQQYLYGNRFVNASGGKFGAIQLNGGRDNISENNWIEGSQWAFSVDGAVGAWWNRNQTMDYNVKKYSGDVSVYDEPYISRFPRTPEIIREAHSCTNTFRRNVIIGAAALKEKRTWHQTVFEDNWMFDKIPTGEELAKTKFKPIPPAGSAGIYGIDKEPEIARPPMIEQKFRDGIGRTFRKLQKGGDVRIGFFGGSITAMYGWRNFILKKLAEDFPQANIIEVNASLGGAGSLSGAFRMRHAILGKKCDLMIIEYATNDTENSPAMNLRSMEGCVRQAWNSDPEMDLLFVYTMNMSQFETYKLGLTSDTAYIHDLIADHYGIPSVNFCPRLMEEINSGRWVYMAADIRNKFGIKPGEPDYEKRFEEAKKKDGRTIFTFDNCHPSADGHKLYHEILAKAFDDMRARNDPPANHAAKMVLPPLAADNMEKAKLVFPDETIFSKGDWSILPKDHKESKKFQRETDRIWFTDKIGAKIRFRFRGRAVQMCNIRGPKSCAIKVSVDGNPPFTRVLADPWSAGSTLIWSEKIFNGCDSIHTVEIEIMRNPKHGGTELELGGLQLDGELL